ncbi:hypothetical protein BDY17DRAFT_127593 [Neohortaea acidophila]|uniref:Uncharacterized protein n=1 Tax=Neohortaea acidophila TaxID=245834 RepID=A0A6A6PXD5_9PEZI|nr:uncharacterized protein BDY17DRAFT_127593 [Neohortaea acidophila]KAF2484394.1 hypothetical protein BDY17DRAFT_127593 [Neohortaea acidophila]
MEPRTSWEMVASPFPDDERREHEDSATVEDDDPTSPALLNFRANARASRDRIATYLRRMREEAATSEKEAVNNDSTANEPAGTVDNASQYARPRSEWPTFGRFPMPEDADPNIVALRLAEADETGETTTGHPFFDNPLIFTADTYPNGRSSFSSTDSDPRIFKPHVDFIDPETPWRRETHPDAPMPWVIGEDDPAEPSTTEDEDRCVVQKGWVQPQRSVTKRAGEAPEIEEAAGEVMFLRRKKASRDMRSDLPKVYQEHEDQDGRKDSRLGTMDLAEVDGIWPPGMRRSSSQRMKRNAVKIVRAHEAENAIESDDEEEPGPRGPEIHIRRALRATENVNPAVQRQTTPFSSPLRTPNIKIVKPDGNEDNETGTSNEAPATSPSPSSASPKRWWQPLKSPKGILKKGSPSSSNISPAIGPRLQWAKDVAFGPRQNPQPGNSPPITQVSTIFAPLYGVANDASDSEMQASTSSPHMSQGNYNDTTRLAPANSEAAESTDSDSTITPLTARRRELVDRLAKHLTKS